VRAHLYTAQGKGGESARARACARDGRKHGRGEAGREEKEWGEEMEGKVTERQGMRERLCVHAFACACNDRTCPFEDTGKKRDVSAAGLKYLLSPDLTKSSSLRSLMPNASHSCCENLVLLLNAFDNSGQVSSRPSIGLVAPVSFHLKPPSLSCK